MVKDGLTLHFLDNDLQFLDNVSVTLVWFVLWDSVERLGERSLRLNWNTLYWKPREERSRGLFLYSCKVIQAQHVCSAYGPE